MNTSRLGVPFLGELQPSAEILQLLQIELVRSVAAFFDKERKKKMIKKLLITKLKEYGESLIIKHGETDIGMIGKIVDGYVEKLSPIKKRITKTMIRHVKNDIDNYVKNVKQKQNNPGTVIDVDFTVKDKK